MKSYKQIKRLKSSFIFTCEHASDFIPSKYYNLGLTSKALRHSKDLFDPGSLSLSLSLASYFNASIIYSKFSRLLIDANRICDAKTNQNNTYHTAALKTELLIEDEKGERLIPIPGNQVRDQRREEKYRWDKYVKPYYKEIEQLTKQLLHEFNQIYIFQIHSFYPKYNGDIRKIDIGVIHNKLPLAKKIVSSIRTATKLHIGDNEPWGMKAVGGGLLKPLQKLRGIHVIGIDVNNKYLMRKSAVNRIKRILSNAIVDATS